MHNYSSYSYLVVSDVIAIFFHSAECSLRQAKSIHPSMCVCTLCIDDRFFFFVEVKRKEKEIGLSYSLHSLSFFRVLWIIINIIHRAHNRKKYKDFFRKNKRDRALALAIIEFRDAVCRLR
jgi:hypothetical protein